MYYPQMETKLSKLKAAAINKDWQKAIAIAARFPRLGNIRAQVLDAHMAYTNPRFAVQIGKNIEFCIENGKSALMDAYGIEQ